MYNTHQANDPCQQDHNLGNATDSLSTVARTAYVSWHKHCQDWADDPVDCRMHTHGEGWSYDATSQMTPRTCSKQHIHWQSHVLPTKQCKTPIQHNQARSQSTTHCKWKIAVLCAWAEYSQPRCDVMWRSHQTTAWTSCSSMCSLNAFTHTVHKHVW